jgi:hypothetical protein
MGNIQPISVLSQSLYDAAKKFSNSNAAHSNVLQPIILDSSEYLRLIFRWQKLPNQIPGE